VADSFAAIASSSRSLAGLICPSPSVPIERAFTFVGEQRDLVPHLNEVHFNQGLKIVRTDRRQFCARGFDVAQNPAKVDRRI
jgi:hypothetical protein